MRFILLLIQLCIASQLLSQVRLTNAPDSSFTSENNAQCIAAHGDFVHVVWTDDRFGNNEIFYKRSHTKGLSWEDDVQLSVSFVYATSPSIATNGNEVHVVWMDHRDNKNEIYYKRSLDNGATWGPDIRLTDEVGEPSHPSLAINDQTLHLVWQVSDHKADEIFYKKSTDGGSTWLPEVRVSNALSNAINPSIAVSGNFIHVVWSKAGGSGIYYRHSLDDGNVWLPQVELTTVASYSEHAMITLSDTMIFAFWSDRRSGNGDIYMRRSVDNGTTWENDLKLPSHANQAISPRAGSAGTYIYLVWSEINVSDWATFESISTDAGVSWTGPTLAKVNHGISTRPFIAFNERDVHIISTEEADGNPEIYYSRSDTGNPFLDHNAYAWGHGLGSIHKDVAYDIIADSAGNVYVTGSFENTMDFDPGPGVVDLVSAGSSDIFIAKYDSTGQLQWAKRAGGPEDDVSYSIKLDNDGHVYATGYFKNTSDFDLGTSGEELISFGQADIFILKLDIAGNFLWVRQMGGSGQDEARSIALDKTGNILTSGSFSETTDFDPSTDIANLLSNGLSDIFISKIDAAGNFLWARSVGGAANDAAHSVTTDEEESVILTGYYSDTVDFDPGADIHLLSTNGLKDIFILKLNTDGQWVWGDSFGAMEDDEGNSITCDKAGNVYSTGSFRKTVDFNPDPPVVNIISHGLTNVYISKLDHDGHYIWAKNFAGNADEGKSISVDNLGNVYTTGSFGTSTDFDPGALQLSLYANNESDVFISKLSADGGFVWVKQLSGSASAQGNAIATRSSSYVYCAGYYFENLDLDPSIGIDLEENHGINEDIFILQLKQCQPQSTSLDVVTCQPYLAPDGITVWTISGTYQMIIPTYLGCDSVITVHLTITQPTENDTDVSACDQFISPDGSIWTASGTYQVVLTNIGGCDSIVNFHLTILQGSETEIEATACSEYSTPDGLHTWTISGVYPIVFTNIAGCDSIINYHVTILQESATEIEATACNQYSTPDGLHTWTVSGIYPLIFTNIAGCDSIVTYHVNIFQNSETEIVASACNEYTTPDGLHTWTESGSYPLLFANIFGCDSIVTYQVNINQNSATEIVASACNEYSTSDGSHTWTESGIYEVILTNIAGCDSVVTYNLIIFYDTDTTVNITACNRYTTPDGMLSWDASGVYPYTLAAITGCDSNIVLVLNIVDVDTTVNATGNILNANQTGAIYQWIDCNNAGAILPEEISQSFSPATIGNYAVIITMNGCSDTSACYPVTITGIDDAENSNAINIYPNPVHDIIHIDLNRQYPKTEIELFNVDGRILKSGSYNDQRFIQFAPGLTPGLYFIAVTFNGYRFVKKVVMI
ncbi:MAG TPA: exo-alpha-sialidase [Saprospiraceae bacterium]|nr:exo-alpha-sialidase [Saprospiraceae bacterium]